MLFGHHAPPLAVAEEFKRDRFHFCFVRHPLSWYKSWWAYRIRRGQSDRRHYADKFHDEDLDRFIHNVLDAHPKGLVTEIYQIYVGPKADQMDFIGRTERLKRDLKKALRLAGQPIQKSFDALPPFNASSSLPEIAPRLHVEPETIERVNAVERWVLETFYV